MPKCQLLERKHQLRRERGVNATDHRCEWRLPMAPWGRMPLPLTHTCPQVQEPWEAQCADCSEQALRLRNS